VGRKASTHSIKIRAAKIDYIQRYATISVKCERDIRIRPTFDKEDCTSSQHRGDAGDACRMFQKNLYTV